MVLSYIFRGLCSRKQLIKAKLFVIVYFSAVTFCSAQQYTLRDQAEINYHAQLTLIEYESLLNLISNSAVSETVLRNAMLNAYQNPSTQIFDSPNVPVEESIAPSSLYLPHKAARKAKDYLRELDAMYVKSDLETVSFYDFQLSGLKAKDFLYILVKYTAHFKGRHKKDPAPYKPVDQLAMFRVEKKENRWITYITSITHATSGVSFGPGAEDVKINTAVVDDGTYTAKLNQLQKSRGAAQGVQEQQARDGAIAESWKAFDEKRFEEFRTKAEQSEDIRAYAEASAFYAQALQVKPKEAAVAARLHSLEKTIQQNGRLEKKALEGHFVEAIKDYGKAISRDTDNADLYYGRGKCYEKLNDLQSAVKDFTTAIRLDANFVAALSSRAQLYVRTAHPQKAIEDYNQIIKNLQDASAYYPERAKIKVALGDVKGALADFDAAMEANPESAALHYEKGQLYYQQKQPEQAQASFSAAIEKDSLFANAFYARGLVYAEGQNISSAAVDFDRARDLGLEKEQLATINSFAIKYSAAGEEAMGKANYKEALANYIKWVLFAPADESAWLKKGNAHFKLHDYENAIQSYARAVALEKISYAYYKRGLAYQQVKDFDAAKNDFRQFVPVGRKLISEKEKKAGQARSSKALNKIAEEIAEAWYTLGEAQRLAEQYKDALGSYNKALEIFKTYPEALFGRGAAYYGLRNHKKAIKDIEKSIEWGIGDNPAVFLILGEVYEASGQLEQAIGIYSYIIDSVDPKYDRAYRQRANCFKAVKQYQLALQDINTSLSLSDASGQDVGLLTSKGLLELHESKFNEAGLSFDKALSIEKNDAWALYGKACVLASQNKLDESLDFYRQAFETKKIQWSAIKDDPIIKHVSKQKAFMDLVEVSLRM